MAPPPPPPPRCSCLLNTNLEHEYAAPAANLSLSFDAGEETSGNDKFVTGGACMSGGVPHADPLLPLRRCCSSPVPAACS